MVTLDRSVELGIYCGKGHIVFLGAGGYKPATYAV